MKQPSPLSLFFRCFLPFRAWQFGWLLLLGANSGCGLHLGDTGAPELEKNSCTSSDECGSGFCSGSICQTGKTEISALLLDVTPASVTPRIAGVGFSQVVEQFEMGPAGDYEVSLGHVSDISAVVTGAELSSDRCVADRTMESGSAGEDGSLLARITLTPRARLLGIANPPFSALAEKKGDGFAVEMVASPGQYDIYVEPQTTDEGCVRPAYLILDQTVAGKFELSIELPPPEVLGVTIRYPAGRDELSGWQLDIVERDTGRLLSNRATLSEPVETDEGLEYSVELAFSQIVREAGPEAAEVVRLSPPSYLVAPTIYVARSVIDLFQDGQGLIDQLNVLPETVDFSARVALFGQATGAPASITFVATQLEAASSGTVTGYSTTVLSSAEGELQAKLFPGTYRVIIEPVDPAYGVAESEVVVTDSAPEQVGKTLEILPRRAVSGRLVSFRGDAVSGVSISAMAAPKTAAPNVLGVALGQQSFSPSSVSRASAADGSFEVRADPGDFHFAARPQSSSGFAWRIVPNVTMESEDISLGRVELPLPVVVNGTLISEDIGSVPDALIRAYAFLKDGQLVIPVEGEEGRVPSEADSVVAVGEARADHEGRFRLLLPSVFE